MGKIIYLMLFLLLISCADEVPSNSSGEAASESYNLGWQPVGFTPDPTTLYTRGSGLRMVTHSGEWILLVDAWTSYVDGNGGLLTYSPRLFISKINMNKWDTLSVPSKSYVRTVYADSTGFYVGTYKTGQIMKYLPNQKKWEEIYVLDSVNGIDYNVYGINKYGNRLIVCLAGIKDSVTQEIVSVMKLQDDNSWIDLETPEMYKMLYNDDSMSIPLQFHKGVELDGVFYAATKNGVWILNSDLKTWTQMPSPPHTKWDEENKTIISPVTEILAHKGKLIVVANSNLIYQWNPTTSSWNGIDSLYLKFREDGDYTIYMNTPHNKETLASDGKHLFVAGGFQPPPMVYMGDYGEPYGIIEKGWRMLRKGWCGKYKCVSTDATYSLDIINGYLYAAAYEGLFRMPLSQLNDVIAGEKDFYGMDIKK